MHKEDKFEMKFLTHIFTKHKIPAASITVAAVALIVYLMASVFAAPPGSQYNPGETLDPTCTPGSANCSVATGGGGWSLTGDTGADTATNFIGTNDQDGLRMETTNGTGFVRSGMKLGGNNISPTSGNPNTLYLYSSDTGSQFLIESTTLSGLVINAHQFSSYTDDNNGWQFISSYAGTAPFTLRGSAGFPVPLRFLAGDISGNYVGFQAPQTIPSSQVWTLPDADGGTGDVLTTDGSGTLSWVAAGGSTPTLSDVLTAGNDATAHDILNVHNIFNHDAIDNLTNYIQFDGAGTMRIVAQDNAAFTSEMRFKGLGQEITVWTNDAGFKGLQYEQDNTANFVDRSLVDKAYVDSVAGGGGSSISEASLTIPGGADGGVTPGIVGSLFSFPQEIVPAPGVGKAIEIVSASAKLDFVGPDVYNGTAGSRDIYLISTSAIPSFHWQFRSNTGPLGSGVSDFSMLYTADNTSGNGAPNNLVENDSISVYKLDGDATQGNSPITVNVLYRIIDL